MTKVLLITFDDPDRPELRDALLEKLDIRWRNGRSYSRGADRYVPALRAHNHWCEEGGRPIRPVLQMAGGLPVLGRVFHKEINGHQLTWIESDLRLASDGLTLPVVPFIQQLVQEYQPELLLSAGLGNATRPDQKPGDILLTSQAIYQLTSELSVSALSNQQPQAQPCPQIDLSRLQLPL